MFLDPSFMAARQEGCRGGAGHIACVPEFERLNVATSRMLDDPDNSVYQLAADGF